MADIYWQGFFTKKILQQIIFHMFTAHVLLFTFKTATHNDNIGLKMTRQIGLWVFSLFLKSTTCDWILPVTYYSLRKQNCISFCNLDSIFWGKKKEKGNKKLKERTYAIMIYCCIKVNEFRGLSGGDFQFCWTTAVWLAIEREYQRLVKFCIEDKGNPLPRLACAVVLMVPCPAYLRWPGHSLKYVPND